MACKMHLARLIPAALGVALAASPLQAMAEEAGLLATDPAALQDLGTIRAHGQRVADRITEVEDAFFARYNALNEDARFAVQCGQATLQSDSLARERQCAPGFAADGRQRKPVRSVQEVCLPNYNYSAGARLTSYLDDQRQYCQLQTRVDYAPAPGVTREVQREYAGNVAAIIGSDTRLQELSAELDGLYDRMEAVQERFLSVRGDAERTSGKSPRGPGPR